MFLMCFQFTAPLAGLAYQPQRFQWLHVDKHICRCNALFRQRRPRCWPVASRRRKLWVARARLSARSINKQETLQTRGGSSLTSTPSVLSPVLPAVFSKHIPVGKQPPGGLGRSEGAYICRAGICLWIRNHLMHITPDKQGRTESGSSVWHQHFLCPTASFSRNTSWITLCLRLCRSATQSRGATNYWTEVSLMIFSVYFCLSNITTK